MRLIEVVAAKQAALGENHQQFADRLGISRQAWMLVRNGQANPGRRTLKGFAKSFPDLHFEIIAYLLEPDKRDAARDGTSSGAVQGEGPHEHPKHTKRTPA
jgi:transcriptional regulator with XRE-family HTH domain